MPPCCDFYHELVREPLWLASLLTQIAPQRICKRCWSLSPQQDPEIRLPLFRIWSRLGALSELFRLFNSGQAPLNRVAEPALWAELERCQESYQAIFAALGFELKSSHVAMPGFISRSPAANQQRLASAWRCYGCACLIPRLMRGQTLSRFTGVAGDKAFAGQGSRASPGDP